MTAYDNLIHGMAQGRDWSLMGDGESVRQLMERAYDERCHSARHHREAYQIRVNLQKKDDSASYAVGSPQRTRPRAPTRARPWCGSRARRAASPCS